MGLRDTSFNGEIIEIKEGIGVGDLVPYTDYPNNDWPDAGYAYQAFTSIYDRENGRNYPIWRNEYDLKRHRAVMRRFIGVSEVSEAITTALKVYTFGKGQEITTEQRAKVEVDPMLVDDVRKIVDRFIEHNDFVNSMDVEMFRRSIDDGECQVSLSQDKVHPRQIYAQFHEADNLMQPMAVDDLEFANYLIDEHGIDIRTIDNPSWEYGVLTPYLQTDRVYGYYIQQDMAGMYWNFFPEWEFVHIKRNVTRNMKRGLSDFFPVKDRIAQVGKLRTNTAVGGALRAAIAWIEESPDGTTQDQLNAITPNDMQYNRPTGLGTGGGYRPQRKTQYNAGSVVRPTPGRKYVEGPASNREEGFMLIDKMMMEATGSRWSMPYYMVSSNASENNYASSLVAESPFVKSREWDQGQYSTHFEKMLWKVVRLAWRLGWLDTRGVPFWKLKELIKISCKFQSPASRDRTALVTQLVQQVDVLGVMSRPTAAAELGLKYEEEVELGAKPLAMGLDASGQPKMEGAKDNPNQPRQTSSLERQPESTPELANASTLQFNRNVKAINKILTDFRSKSTTRAHAKQMLLAVGMQDQRADALLDDAEHGQDTEALSAIESVKIMESTVCGETPSGVHRCSVKLSELSRFGRISDRQKPLDPSGEYPPIVISKSDTGRVDLLDGHHRTNGFFKWAEIKGKHPQDVDIPAIHVTDEGLANSIADSSDRDRQQKIIDQVTRSLNPKEVMESYDESKHPRDEHGHWASVSAANEILDKHGFRLRSEIGENGEPTVDLEDLQDAHHDVEAANKILAPHGESHGESPARLKYIHGIQRWGSTIHPETAEQIDDDITRSNKVLEQHGLPKAKLVKKDGEWKSSHDPYDLEYDHNEVKRVNKLLEKHGLEPKIKLRQKGGKVEPSHDLDNVESALDELKDFRSGKLKESHVDLRILRQFGLEEIDTVESSKESTLIEGGEGSGVRGHHTERATDTANHLKSCDASGHDAASLDDHVDTQLGPLSQKERVAVGEQMGAIGHHTGSSATEHVKGVMRQKLQPSGGSANLHSVDLPSFANKVKALAKVAPAGERFHDNKAFIQPLHAASQRDQSFPRMGLDEFKKHLLNAHQAGHLVLSRADMIGEMNPHLVKSSETTLNFGGNQHKFAPDASYHFVVRESVDVDLEQVESSMPSNDWGQYP